jgi:hypothetical protein
MFEEQLMEVDGEGNGQKTSDGYRKLLQRQVKFHMNA